MGDVSADTGDCGEERVELGCEAIGRNGLKSSDGKGVESAEVGVGYGEAEFGLRDAIDTSGEGQGVVGETLDDGRVKKKSEMMIAGFARWKRNEGRVELKFAAGPGGIVGDLQNGRSLVGESEIKWFLRGEEFEFKGRAVEEQSSDIRALEIVHGEIQGPGIFREV